MSSLTASEKKMYATVIGALAASASLALYAFFPKGAEGEKFDGDEATVESELSAIPPELTEEEKKARDETRAAAHKRLKEKCMVKKTAVAL